MKKLLFFSAVVLCLTHHSLGQQLGIPFRDAEQHGIIVKNLESIYKSAVHVDTSLAVFKTDDERDTLLQEYKRLLLDFGKFLGKNNFEWDKPTRCFNRIYFNYDGTIDYFLFNFLGTTEAKPTEEKQKEFQRLLNLFIKDYKFPVTAEIKFAQCGRMTFMPE